MTIEEAKDTLNIMTTKNNYIHSSDVKLLIDDIFDDFKNRVCENCKFFTYCDDGFHYCDNPLNTGFNGLITEDFGCNNFERR